MSVKSLWATVGKSPRPPDIWCSRLSATTGSVGSPTGHWPGLARIATRDGFFLAISGPKSELWATSYYMPLFVSSVFQPLDVSDRASRLKAHPFLNRPKQSLIQHWIWKTKLKPAKIIQNLDFRSQGTSGFLVFAPCPTPQWCIHTEVRAGRPGAVVPWLAQHGTHGGAKVILGSWKYVFGDFCWLFAKMFVENVC